jgi:hypothetical protein
MPASALLFVFWRAGSSLEVAVVVVIVRSLRYAFFSSTHRRRRRRRCMLLLLFFLFAVDLLVLIQRNCERAQPMMID